MPTNLFVGATSPPIIIIPSPADINAAIVANPGGPYGVNFFEIADANDGTSASMAYTGQTCACAAKVNVFPSFGSMYMEAAFVAPPLSTVLDGQTPTLADYQAACGFSSINWQQLITDLPSGSDVQPNSPIPLIDTGNVSYSIGPGVSIIASASNGFCAFSWVGCSLIAPPAFNDPPAGGYTYISTNPYPYVYRPADLVPGKSCTFPLQIYGALGQLGGCPPFPYKISSDNTTLSFLDAPITNGLMAFKTTLVGVGKLDGVVHPLYSWTWYSTFNGKDAGGVTQTASLYPLLPGSGTGGVTITSINGVQLPPVVPPNQVATTASGLAYSRVSQTFNGTVTLRNISSSAVSGPLQIVFFGMPANVTLVNATANLSGTPYLTVSGVASLAPGQSATVSVQFKNPSNAALNLAPVIYSGSIN